MQGVNHEKLAEQLYEALLDLVRVKTGMGLLSALGDLQSRVPYAKVASKTRVLFYELADNLTRIQARG
jgi:hypothetical protein